MTRAPSFFERRRAGLQAEREAEKAAELAASQPEVAEAPQEPDLSEMSDPDILELLNLPDPDTMRKGDNFAAFMAKAVPLHLRNRALRNLWRSDPVLACLDGLNDYDADYLTGSTGQGIIKTSYQVGKGLTAHVEKMAEQLKQSEIDAAQPEIEEPAATIAMDEESEEVIAREPEKAAQPVDAAPENLADEPVPEQQNDASGALPRRMRFDFAGDRA